MVQVIPRTPTALESVGEGFGAGFGGAIQGGLSSALDDFFQRRQQQREMGRINQAIKKLGPNATDEQRLSAIAASGAKPEVLKSFFEIEKRKGLQNYLERMQKEGMTPELLYEGAAKEYIPAGVAQEQMRLQAQIPKAKQTQQIANLYEIPSGILEGIDPSQAFKFANENEERNVKLDTDIVDKSTRVAQESESIQDLASLIKKGALSPKSWGNLADVAQESGHEIIGRVFRAFESPESAEAQTLLKEFFTGLKDIVPAKGMTLYIERLFRTMLPIMGRSPEANMAALKVIEKMNKLKQTPGQIREEILKENEGKLPWNFAQEYRNRLARRGLEQGEKLQSELEEVIEKYGSEGKQSVSRDSEKAFEKLPDASQFKGKIIRNPETGQRLRSDGKKWKAI